MKITVKELRSLIREAVRESINEARITKFDKSDWVARTYGKEVPMGWGASSWASDLETKEKLQKIEQIIWNSFMPLSVNQILDIKPENENIKGLLKDLNLTAEEEQLVSTVIRRFISTLQSSAKRVKKI
jgi:hypothetical protein